MFEDKTDSIADVLVKDPALGYFKYKDEICKVMTGKYNELVGTYCSRVNKGIPTYLEQLSPEASAVVIGYSEKLSLEDAVEFAKDIQIFFQDEYLLDAFSDNSLCCVVTTGDNTTEVHLPYVRVIRKDYNDLHFYGLLRHLNNDKVFNPMTRDFVPMYGSDDQEYLCCVQDIGHISSENPSVDQLLIDLDQFDHLGHTKIEFDHNNSNALKAYEYEGMTETMWLPLILSVDYWRTITRKRDKSKEIENQFRRAERSYPDLDPFKYYVPIIDTPWGDEHYTLFVDMWEPNRVFSPVYWMDIGKALKTFWSKDPRRGLTHWVEILLSSWTFSCLSCILVPFIISLSMVFGSSIFFILCDSTMIVKPLGSRHM